MREDASAIPSEPSRRFLPLRFAGTTGQISAFTGEVLHRCPSGNIQSPYLWCNNNLLPLKTTRIYLNIGCHIPHNPFQLRIHGIRNKSQQTHPPPMRYRYSQLPSILRRLSANCFQQNIPIPVSQPVI